jgi:hypothetical protein
MFYYKIWHLNLISSIRFYIIIFNSIQMKAERTFTDITNQQNFYTISVKTVQIRKVANLDDLKLLKSKMTSLKKAVLIDGKLHV